MRLSEKPLSHCLLLSLSLPALLRALPTCGTITTTSSSTIATPLTIDNNRSTYSTVTLTTTNAPLHRTGHSHLASTSTPPSSLLSGILSSTSNLVNHQRHQRPHHHHAHHHLPHHLTILTATNLNAVTAATAVAPLPPPHRRPLSAFCEASKTNLKEIWEIRFVNEKRG